MVNQLMIIYSLGEFDTLIRRPITRQNYVCTRGGVEFTIHIYVEQHLEAYQSIMTYPCK